MKRFLACLVLAALPAYVLAAGGPCFDDYFEDATLRVDYYHTGNAAEEFIALDQLYRVETWAGNPAHLIDDLNYGRYCVKVYDVASNTLIFSRGFSSIFAEYKTTTPARDGVMKTFHATALAPFPRRPVLLVVERRDRQNLLSPIFTSRIDPADVNIVRESPNAQDRVCTIAESGPPQSSVDLVFVAEGYTAEEYDKFSVDAGRFAQRLLEAEPFKSRKGQINIAGVFRASAESGVDEPDMGVFRNTALSAAYNALDLPRYLLVDDTKALRDAAGRVPYDAVIVIANTTRYGGGGIYGDYAIFTAYNRTSEDIFLHEFGHSFANLADEYFNAAVAYDEFFPPGIEPLEPNITALLDPENVKWKDLLSPDIPIPTPWGQEEIEKLRADKTALAEKLNRRIERLQSRNASAQAIERVREGLKEQTREIDEKIQKVRQDYRDMYRGKMGVFEGAGYTAKGLYRSCIDVGFFHNGGYNAVSRRAIERMIDYYAGGATVRSDAD